jgi:hypothetical protein
MNPSLSCCRLLGAAALAISAAAHAQAAQHYACSIAIQFGPNSCHGAVAPSTDTVSIDLDPQHQLWRLSDGSLDGPAEVSDSGILLKRWGGRDGRDAHIDRASGAFSYQVKSDCLVETQSGICKLVSSPSP